MPLPHRAKRGIAPMNRTETSMNWDQIAGQWKQMGADIKSRWAKLTDDDLQNLGAKKDMLVAKVQERYGILKEEAEHQVDEWIEKISPNAKTPSVPQTKRNDNRPPKHA
jgi:uncharacterized protein YjbJ (UPF0337 family)